MSKNQMGQSDKVQWIEIDAQQAGQRIDNFLLRHWKGVPRSLIYRVLRKGEVRVNKGRIGPSYRLCAGDSLRLPPVRRQQPGEVNIPQGAREAIRAASLYEDSDYLIVDKPPQWAVHGGSGQAFGVIEALRQARPDLEGLELAHRLDRDTSGCLVLAKHRQALLAFQEQSKQQAMTKTYLALTLGRWQAAEVIDAPLKRIDRAAGAKVSVDDEGKPARSVVTPVQGLAGGRFTLVEVSLKTGRTHQIRVHCAWRGHPLAGDPLYGDAEQNRRLVQQGLSRLFLHAHRIAFVGPSGEVDVSAPLAPDLKQFLEQLQHDKQQ